MPYDPSFYEDRLRKEVDPRMAVWNSTEADRERYQRETIEISKEHIKPGMSVLDVGCGIGELVDCLPPGCLYFGIDYCSGFIQEAKRRYPTKCFDVVDVTKELPSARFCADIAVCRTVQGVIGEPAWGHVVKNLLMCVPKILVFRAMPTDGGMAKTLEVIGRDHES